MKKVACYLSGLAALLMVSSTVFAQPIVPIPEPTIIPPSIPSIPMPAASSTNSVAPFAVQPEEGVVYPETHTVYPQAERVIQSTQKIEYPARPIQRAEIIGPVGAISGTVHSGYWQPGYYQPTTGSPYFYSAPGQGARGPMAGGSGYPTSAGSSPAGDPYGYHFGPGYYRSGEYGHYRFPYYSYRRPWYYPGFDGYNRDTNLPW